MTKSNLPNLPKALPRTEQANLERALKRKMMRTVGEFGLIKEGDKILVAISGGKDSYVMLDLLWRAKRVSPVHFDLVAVHLDQQQPGYDGRPLRAWLEAFGAPYEIVTQDTYSVVVELTKPGGTYCSVCSRMRRGILYNTAERLGCNKLALGHHRDDALETLLMNLFFQGRLQAMPASYQTIDGRFEVIRPLIECAEADIARYAQLLEFPILPCNLCGSQPGMQRDAMGDLITQLEASNPHIRDVMLAALKNVRGSHLLDTALQQGPVAIDPKEDPLEALGGGCDSSAQSAGEALVIIGG